MARRSKRSARSRSRQGGSTLYGLLIGLFLGLVVAAAVAFYITKAPMPFADRATRDVAPRPIPDPRNAPDPNRALTGRNAAGGTPAAGPTATPMVPLPGSSQPLSAPPKEDLDSLIAALGAPGPTGSGTARAPDSSDAAYFLQVGAFRVVEDADALRARVLMMGLPVEIQRAEVNGALVNRVRVGPYRRLDDMNRVRAQLGQEKIASTVVRQ